MTGQRLFVAVVPPHEVVAAWDALLEPRRDAESSLRWTVPEGWHLTCAFLPGVPEGLLEPLQEALDGVAARTSPFPIEVSGAGAFPDPDAARALWLGVSRGAKDLSRLARRCRTAASGSGIEVDGGRFRPHLTVARSRPGNATRWLRILETLPAQSWTVEQFALIRSSALPGGAGYRTLSEHRLTGSALS